MSTQVELVKMIFYCIEQHYIPTIAFTSLYSENMSV